MKPQIKLGEALTPDGGRLTLHRHDGHFSVRLNGQELMHSAVHVSEVQLGTLAVARMNRSSPGRLLLGGLGLGFTLKAVLDSVAPSAVIEVAELIPEIVAWNKSQLLDLNGTQVLDPRVTLIVGDVRTRIVQAGCGIYDAIILDVDNGPSAMVTRANQGLYDRGGLTRIRDALRNGGRLAVWSAARDQPFEQRLASAGFTVEVVPAKVHATARRAAYTLYLADKLSSAR